MADTSSVGSSQLTTVTSRLFFGAAQGDAPYRVSDGDQILLRLPTDCFGTGREHQLTIRDYLRHSN